MARAAPTLASREHTRVSAARCPSRPSPGRPDRGSGVGKEHGFGPLRDLGAVVIDADVLAREVVAPGTDGLAAVVEEFGPGVLTADGGLDRVAMGAIVFGDQGRRRALEAIIHPRVRARGEELEASAPPGSIVVHDIPLLVETGQPSHFDA